jgi:5-oxopent-3-ene-1,2,5-tricarboxylate decarboxylase / 2-hydroxyhepta-2,4-diene-1,7-dioate isomerase
MPAPLLEHNVLLNGNDHFDGGMSIAFYTVLCALICDPLSMTDRARSVIGVALNFRETIDRLSPSFASAPYNRPPQAPVLYLKTPNTWIASGHPIPCPKGIAKLRMGGTLGIVIGRSACRVNAKDAWQHISAFTVVNDVSIPHDSFYRPALRERCSDCFCSIGPPSSQTSQPMDFEINVVVNNILRSHIHTGSLVRSIPYLIQDISEFMTLHPDDILLVGDPESSPLCGIGDGVRVEIPGVGSIENKVVEAL